jgi:hypothetical protein
MGDGQLARLGIKMGGLNRKEDVPFFGFHEVIIHIKGRKPMVVLKGC